MGSHLLHRAQRYRKIAEGLTDHKDRAEVHLLATQLADISKIEVLEVPLERTGAFSETVARIQRVMSIAYEIDPLNPIVLESLFGEVVAPYSDQLPTGNDKNG